MVRFFYKLVVFSLLLSTSIFAGVTKVVNPEKLPKKLYVAVYLADRGIKELDPQKKEYIENLLRENIRVNFYSKGFKILDFDIVNTDNPQYLLNEIEPEEGEGILLLKIKNLTLFYIAVAGRYNLSGEAYIITPSGKVYGPWKASVDKKEVHIPTSLLDVAKLFLSAVTKDTDTEIYNLVQVFIHKLAMQIPDLPESAKSLKLYFVNWIVGSPDGKEIKTALKRGDVIYAVVEGQPGLEGFLEIPKLGVKRPISHSESSPSVYIAKYQIKKGDLAEDVEVSLTFTNKYGDKLTIYYPTYLKVDGVPPASPVNLKAEVLPDAVRLTWDTVQITADFDHFAIYRKTYKEKDYKLIATTKDSSFVDKQVKEGSVYDYKVAAVDRIGNISDESTNPVLRVVFPLHREVYLKNRPLKGELPAATYIVGENVKVPKGETLFINYSKFIFIQPLKVEGTLSASHVNFIGNPNAAIFSDRSYPLSDCLIVEGGKVDLYKVKFAECKRAIFVKEGSLKGTNIVLDRNKVNVVSYEPLKVKLERVNFNTIKVEDFKLRGKLVLKSYKNPFNGSYIEVTPKVLMNLARQLDSLTVSYTRTGDLKTLKKFYEAYVPIMSLRGGIFQFYDRKLIELCRQLKDLQCLKDYLPPLIKLYPEDGEFAVIYAKVLYNLYGKKKACEFITNYTIQFGFQNSPLNTFKELIGCP